jgi:cytidine deaminase
LGEYRADAERLSQRDEEEVEDKYGQNVRKTFPLADLFLDITNPSEVRRSVFTFIELFFGHPLHTPKRDEYAMFHAQAAALRSGALGRQVGAVIATKDGDVIAVGTNEVPRAGGGLYWAEETPDHRDFTLGYDTNDRIKFNIVGDILQKLAEKGWLSADKKDVPVEDLVKAALKTPNAVLPKNSQVMNLTEFSRTVHAEMAALLNAANRGIGVAGGVLYTTTFPCHNCAKHIVAAGISRVVYVEPYPKSLAMDLHLDAIEVDGAGCTDKLRFTSFVGIAPRQYMNMFSAPERKNEDGDVVKWNPVAALPRFSTPTRVYVSNETNDLIEFEKLMVAKGLNAVK